VALECQALVLQERHWLPCVASEVAPARVFGCAGAMIVLVQCEGGGGGAGARGGSATAAVVARTMRDATTP